MDRDKRYYGDGGFFDYLDKKAAEWEPATNVLALSSDAVGLGTAITGVGAPIGAAITTIGNLPNLGIDLYLAGRGWYKVATQEDKPVEDALWNTGEAALGLFGAGAIGKGVKRISDKRFANAMAEKIAEERAKREGKSVFIKNKYGLTDEETAAYLNSKAVNAAMNSKDIADSKRKRDDFNKKYVKPAQLGVSALLDGYHVILDYDLSLKAIDRAIQEVEEDYNLNEVPNYIPLYTHEEGGFIKHSWNDLSIFLKGEIMKMAILSGIRDLNAIKEIYNS